MGFYIHEIFKTETDSGAQSDYDYLNDQMSLAVDAANKSDATGLESIRNDVTESLAADGSLLISEEQFDAWVSSTFKPSYDPLKDENLDQHFADKTTLKETREQSYENMSEEQDLDGDGVDDRIQEIEGAFLAGQDALGEAILQEMYNAAIESEDIPSLDLETNPAATLADRARWAEQCFLVNHIEQLAELKRAYNRDYSYVDCIDGPPTQFMNRLYNRPFSDTFMDINPDDASELTPYFRLYKVMYSWEEDGKGGWKTKYESEIPIIFESMARQDLIDYDVGKTRIELAGLKDPDGKPISQPGGSTLGQGVPATGYSWEKFEWTYKGSNPETIRNDITARLALTFQDFNQLSKQRIHVPDPVGEEKTPDPVAYSLLDLLGFGPASYKRQKNRADEYHEKFFEIKVVCGWHPHNFREDPSKAKLAKAVENQRVTMYLTLIDHEFDINDLGTFSLNLNYRARLETVLTEPKADILSNADFRDALDILNKQTEVLKKACDYEGLDQVKDAYFRTVEEFRRSNLKNIIDKLVSCGEGPILKDVTDRQAHDQLPQVGNLAGNTGRDLNGRVFLAQPLITDLAAFATGVRDPASLEPTAAAESSSASNTSTSMTSQLDDDLNQINTNWNSGAPQVKDSADTILSALQEVTADKEVFNGRANVPFIYLGDLLEVAADMALNQQYFETGELVSLTPNEANRIKIVLGPYEFFNGIENHTINLADVPISIRAFTDFWYKNVVAARRENYLLLHFVRDVIEKLVVDALGADCFAFNGHPLGSTPTRLRTSFLTLYPNEDPARPSGAVYSDPLLNLGKSVYANNPSEGFGTIKLNQLNIVDGSGQVQNALKNPALEELYNVEDLTHYLVVYAESSEPWDLKGEIEKDAERGIYHMQIHKGILHQARFKKTDQPYLREARYQRTGYNPLVHMSNVYDVSLSMLGNTLFYPGSYVFINPLGFGTSLGDPTAQNSISNIMGLGGYHFIIDVTNTIGKTFTTSMGVRWDNNGSGSPRTMETQVSKDDEADCPPVPG